MENTMARRIRALAGFVLISVALLPTSSAQSTWSKLKKGFLQQACKGGDQNACQQLAKLNGKPQATRPAQPQPAPASTPQAQQESVGTDVPSHGAPTPAADQQPADSPPAQAWVPPTQETTPAQLAGPLDPRKLPDIQGIHLGMTVAQANQVLIRLAPGSQPGWYNLPINIPTTTNTIGHAATARELSYDWIIAPAPWGKTARNHIVLEATRPPDAERIWHIGLRTQFQNVNRAVLLAALRKKYGKEFAAMGQADTGGTRVVNEDSRIQEMWWVFDEKGHPLSPAPSIGSDDMPNGCSHPDVATSGGDPYASQPACMWVGVYVRFSAAQIIGGYDLVAWDAALKIREEKATDAWLNAQLVKARQAALQRSKEAKPTM